MSRARRRTPIARNLNVLAIATGVAGIVVSVPLHYLLGIALGFTAAVLGAIGLYLTRRQS